MKFFLEFLTPWSPLRPPGPQVPAPLDPPPPHNLPYVPRNSPGSRQRARGSGWVGLATAEVESAVAGGCWLCHVLYSS